MMQFMVNMLMMISSFIFSQLNHPLAMGFLLLIQTILICMATGLLTNSFWFSYMLFLVFIGGMLVLFIYVTSLASNEMFNFSFKLVIVTIMMILIATMISLMVDYMNLNANNNKEMNQLKLNLYMTENFSLIYKLYNFPTNWITCLIINYLMFTLIVVVKITNFFYGPIRHLN